MVFFLFVPLLSLYNYGKNGMIFFCLFRCYPYNLQLQERSDLKPAIVELAKLESIIINGQRKYITTDRRVKASSFNTKTQKVAKDKATNEYLEALRAKVYAQETEMIKNSIEVTMETFIDIYKNGFTSNTITILQLFKLHNDQFVTLVEKNLCAATTLDKYNVTKSYLESFIKEQLNKEDVLVKDITPKMVEDFFIYSSFASSLTCHF